MHNHQHKNKEGEKVSYICPMDLEVVSSKLGACPECGMDLIRAVEKGAPKMGNSVKEHDSKEHDSCHDKSFGDGMGSEMNGGMGMGHGSAGDFLRRFWLVSILLVPLVFTNEAIAGFLNFLVFGFKKWNKFCNRMGCFLVFNYLFQAREP